MKKTVKIQKATTEFQIVNAKGKVVFKSNKEADAKKVLLARKRDGNKAERIVRKAVPPKQTRKPAKKEHPVKEAARKRANTKEIKTLARKISKAKVEQIKALGLAVKQARKTSLQAALKARAKQVHRLADLGITRVQYGALIEHYRING